MQNFCQIYKISLPLLDKKYIFIIGMFMFFMHIFFCDGHIFIITLSFIFY